jgi:hypothetical protein
MSGKYRIFGAEVSPYSVKVRSYFRYKQIPHEWIVRGPSSTAEYQKYAKLPIIPLVVSPEGEAMQDSTPIIETLEQRFPEPSIHPDDPVASFVSALLEEFGDEWGNKWMFHYRWAREADQISRRSGSARRCRGVGRCAATGGGRGSASGWSGACGSSAATRRPPADRGWVQGRVAPDRGAPRRRPYLFGARPRSATSGCGARSTTRGPIPRRARSCATARRASSRGVERMLDPKAEGPFEPWAKLAPTLAPLLVEQVGRRFLPWSHANAKAIADGAEEFSVELAGQDLDAEAAEVPRQVAEGAAREVRGRKEPPLDKALADVGCSRAAIALLPWRRCMSLRHRRGEPSAGSSVYAVSRRDPAGIRDKSPPAARTLNAETAATHCSVLASARSRGSAPAS